MGTRFVPADSSDEIMFGTDRDSHRTFWATVMFLAMVEKAEEVRYRLDSEHDCLALVIDGQVYAMDPPPFEYRRGLLTAIRKFACDGFLQRCLARLSMVSRRASFQGTVTFEGTQGIVLWQVHANSSGVTLCVSK